METRTITKEGVANVVVVMERLGFTVENCEQILDAYLDGEYSIFHHFDKHYATVHTAKDFKTTWSNFGGDTEYKADLMVAVNDILECHGLRRNWQSVFRACFDGSECLGAVTNQWIEKKYFEGLFVKKLVKLGLVKKMKFKGIVFYGIAWGTYFYNSEKFWAFDIVENKGSYIFKPYMPSLFDKISDKEYNQAVSGCQEL